MILRSQQTATEVFERVQAVATAHPSEEKPDKEYKDAYAGAAHNLPILIRQARLCHALAFQNTRTKDGAKDLARDLAVSLGYVDADTMAQFARSAPLSEYIRLHNRALETLLWFKRYAVSVLDRDISKLQNQNDDDVAMAGGEA